MPDQQDRVKNPYQSSIERKYIYDANGNKIYLPVKPDMEEVGVVRLQDVYSEYPSQGLTVTQLASILKEADAGIMHRQMELFEEIEEKDTRIFSCLQTRKQAVIGLDWDIIPADEQDRNSVAQAEFVKEVMSGISNFQEAQLDLLDAIGKGYAVVEVMWDIRDGRNVIAAIKWRHQKRFVWNDTQTELRLITDAEPSKGESLANYPAKFIIHQYKGRSGYPARAGLLRTLAWFYLFKSYNIKDWIRFCEVYGMPLRLGKYDPSATKADRAALRTAVQSIGADGAGIISKSTELQFVSALNGAANGDVYKTFIDMVNQEISIVILGQNLTTEVKEGSRAAAQVHDKVRQDLLEADCIALDKTITQQLVVPLVIFNFGPQAVYPRYKTAYEPAEDLIAEAQRDKTLVETGVPIGVNYFRQKYNLPEPAKDEQIVILPGRTPVLMKQDADGTYVAMSQMAQGTIISEHSGRFSPRQQGVEDIGGSLLKEYAKLYPDMEAKLTNIVMSAGSLDQIRDRIYLAFSDIASDDMELLIARGMLLAELYGRRTVK
ncbi:MAG: DUF935 domain-containing protein [bacterium]